MLITPPPHPTPRGASTNTPSVLDLSTLPPLKLKSDYTLLHVTGAAMHAEVVSLEEELANLTDKNSKLEDELSTLENRKYCSPLSSGVARNL